MSWTNVGSPVGIAEIAVVMPSRIRVSVSWPRAMPTMAITATAPHARKPKIFVSPSSSIWSGDFTRFVAVTMSAMCPICVEAPVATTTTVADPRVTRVFWKTRFVRSPSATSVSASAIASLAIGALSPVRDAS